MPEDKFGVVCFYEELDSPFGEIVPHESSQLGGWLTLPIRATHTGMCKYSDKDEASYQRVLGILQRWVKEIRSSGLVEEVEQVSGMTLQESPKHCIANQSIRNLNSRLPLPFQAQTMVECKRAMMSQEEGHITSARRVPR